MMTSSKYCVVWCYREGDTAVRRTLHSATVDGCIEAARLISNNVYAFEIQVLESDTGKSIDWEQRQIGRVLVRCNDAVENLLADGVSNVQ